MGMMIHRYKGRSRDNASTISEERSLGTAEMPVEENYSDDGIAPETQEESGIQYTKTDIMQMKTADLQTLAAENGIEDAYEKTGSTLKQELIEKFGL